jgi:hypothetical protein
MNKLFAFSALAAIFAASAAADANAWSRSGSFTGPRGTSSVHAQGSCSGGTCNRTITRTGPYGGSVTHSGSTSCANGSCTHSGSTMRH